MRNRQEQRGFLEKEGSHGILVYEKGEPVGGASMAPGRSFLESTTVVTIEDWHAGGGAEQGLENHLLVVDNSRRKRRVAGTALKAALKAITKKGGGLVEAYPVALWEGASFGNVSNPGAVSMFEKAGYKAAPFGDPNILMGKAFEIWPPLPEGRERDSELTKRSRR